MNTLEQLRAGALAGARRLNLCAGLSEFPREIYTLADSLEILDLCGNELSSLPEDLPRLSRLRVLFCSQNRFTELPPVLGRCRQLRMIGFKSNRIRSLPAEALPPTLCWLTLTDNELETLPAEIGRCRSLQKLLLAGNRLRALPSELAACERLELLRVAANRLEAFPEQVLRLPALAWLAYAGNPFCASTEANVLATTGMPGIPWARLQLQRTLGEGASGVIHQALDRGAPGGRPTPVAVKLFKGEVTSDGLPGNEMLACLRAGSHPQLIPVLGRVVEHPEAAQGLVMDLIDPEFRNLAGPPSLESCSRDVYTEAARYDLPTVLRIAQGIASAAAQLHGRGVLHGDLYAHNILHCGRGRALLGDFGAASCYLPDDTAQARALQGLEVLAYGILLAELLARCQAPAVGRPILAALTRLGQDCRQPLVAHRPTFPVIEALLSKLRNAAEVALGRRSVSDPAHPPLP